MKKYLLALVLAPKNRLVSASTKRRLPNPDFYSAPRASGVTSKECVCLCLQIR